MYVAVRASTRWPGRGLVAIAGLGWLAAPDAATQMVAVAPSTHALTVAPRATRTVVRHGARRHPPAWLLITNVERADVTEVDVEDGGRSDAARRGDPPRTATTPRSSTFTTLIDDDLAREQALDWAPSHTW